MYRTQQAHLCHHGGNRELLRGYLSFLSEERKNSSELRNLSSEVSFHSSELLFRPSVKKNRFPASYRKIPREERPTVRQFRADALYIVIAAQ